jgi:putative serine protease PepD
MATFCTECGQELVDGRCTVHGPHGETAPGSTPVPDWVDALTSAVTAVEPLLLGAGPPVGREAAGALPPPVVAAAPPRRRRRTWAAAVLLAVALIAVPTVFAVLLSRQVSDLRSRLDAATAAQSRAADALRKDVNAQSDTLRGVGDRLSQVESKVNQQPDTAAIARKVGPSVFEVETDAGLGTGWVVASGGGSSQLVTNYHVVADVWESGGRSVSLHQGDATYIATITKVDAAGDLALLSTRNGFPVLDRETATPNVGDPVLVVGSSLGLEGTVASGLVSGFRHEQGRDLVQFSAPVSPGNSGGPVVDRAGRVIGVTELKIVTSGAEGLSFAIPVAALCKVVLTC